MPLNQFSPCSADLIIPRYRPPTRRSIAISGQAKDLGPIQRFMCSALDHSANTTDAGALKVRTINSSLSATLFFRTPITFPFAEFLEVGGHLVEALLPEAPIDRQPVVDGLKAFWLELARPPLCLAAARNEASALEHLEMPGDRRQADLEGFGQLVHGGLAVCEARENGASRWVGQGRKGGRQQVGHT